MKKKVTTIRQNFGKEVMLSGGKSIKFGPDGMVELEENFAKELLEKYPNMIIDPNKKIEVPKQNTVVDKINANMEQEIQNLKGQLERKKREIETAIADKKEWGKLAEEKDVEVSTLKKQLEIEKASYESSVKLFQLEISLLKTNTEKIKDICDKSGFKKEEWEKLGKGDLIEYVLKKSK